MNEHDGSHGPDCFGCKVRSIQFSPQCTPSRRSPVPPRKPNNSWEKGILRDDRGLPVTKGGKVIGVKEYAENRHAIDEQVRAVKQGLL